MGDITQTGVCIEIRPKHWMRIDGIPSDLTTKESEKLKRFIEGWRLLMLDAQTIEEVTPPTNDKTGG